jgi:hypothetical protein
VSGLSEVDRPTDAVFPVTGDTVFVFEPLDSGEAETLFLVEHTGSADGEPDPYGWVAVHRTDMLKPEDVNGAEAAMLQLAVRGQQSYTYVWHGAKFVRFVIAKEGADVRHRVRISQGG